VSGTPPIPGATAQFSSTATLSNGTTQSVTTQATWTSSNPLAATVTSAGLVTGVSAGEADITATYQSIAGKLHVAIGNATIPTFTVSGSLTDGTSGGALPNINVQTVDSGGNTATTKTGSSGTYAIGGLAAGAAVLTASATSYETATKNIIISGETRVDVVLARTPPPPPCLYVITGALDAFQVPVNGGSFTAGLLRTSGQCSWQAATNDPWITIVTPSGSDSGTLRYTVSELTNPPQSGAAVLPLRQGRIVVSWPGSEAAFAVTQVSCRYTPLPAMASAPAAGGSFGPYLFTGSGNCPFRYSTDVAWLTISRSNTTFSVTALPNTSATARSGTVIAGWPGGGSQMTVVQAGTQP
jgi:hypothetical protein